MRKRFFRNNICFGKIVAIRKDDSMTVAFSSSHLALAYRYGGRSEAHEQQGQLVFSAEPLSQSVDIGDEIVCERRSAGAISHWTLRANYHQESA
jgi:hypothetical protein